MDLVERLRTQPPRLGQSASTDILRDEAADKIEQLRAALEKIANMFQEANFGATLLKPNYGYYDVLKAAQAALKE